MSQSEMVLFKDIVFSTNEGKYIETLGLQLDADLKLVPGVSIPRTCGVLYQIKKHDKWNCCYLWDVASQKEVTLNPSGNTMCRFVEPTQERIQREQDSFLMWEEVCSASQKS